MNNMVSRFKPTKHTKLFKVNDKYIVLYAEATKSKEFTSESAARDWVKQIELEYQ